MADINKFKNCISPYCEIQELSIEEISGKAKVKMSALQIHTNNFDYQTNGVNWVKQHVLDNIESAKHMHYVVSWLNEEEQIPCHHGNQKVNEYGEVTFADSVVVGDVRDVYFETIDVDGVPTEVLMTEGFINIQRYNKFYHWLKSEIAKGTVYGSVEFRGKKNGKIIYKDNKHLNVDGTPLMGRQPKIFDFSDLAILYITDPADSGSQVIEINNNQNINKNKEEKPMEKNDVTETVVELNTKLIESNNKINNITNELNTVKTDLANSKNDILAKETELNALNLEKNELSEAVVSLNKKVTELENEKVELNKELDELKTYKKNKEDEEIEAEVNSYFENEISQNGFTDVEINELKVFVEKNDIDGLKNAEKDLVLKKHKESLSTSCEVEVNNFINKASSKKKDALTKNEFWA